MFGIPCNHRSLARIALLIYSIILTSINQNVIGFPKISNDDTILSYPDNDIDMTGTSSNSIESIDQDIKTESPKSLWQLNGSVDELRQLQSIIMQTYMNTTVNPCEDFYKFACGNWENIHPIPTDAHEFNVFSFMNNNILEALTALLSEPTPEHLTDSKLTEMNAEEKSKLYYKSCLDVDTLNQRGAEPLLNYIDSLGGWPALDDNWDEENFDFIELCAKVSKLGYKHFFSLAVEIDLKKTDQYVLYLEPMTLGLESREDYLSDDENSPHLLAYRNFIITILQLLDFDHAKAEATANEIITFETKIANETADYRVNTPVNEQYVPTTIGDLAKDYNGLNLTRYFNLVFDKEFEPDQYVVLFAVPNFSKRIEFIQKTDNRTLANFLIWRSIVGSLIALDDRFLAAMLTFGEALSGQTELEPRWKICVTRANLQMGMAVGAQYVRKYFNESSKLDVSKLTREIQNTFTNTLQNLDWIDDETKIMSEEKANVIKVVAGYPDFILSKEQLNKYYDSIHIQKGKYFENNLQLMYFESMKNFKRLGQKVDKTEWPTHPAVVNAFFEPTKNRIIIPAGVLQPPIYHRSLPKSLNYGGIGVFVGHELTHGFDNIGRDFDITGNMKTWWTNKSVEEFTEKSNCFVDQYSNFSIHDQFISGESSLGENIADNGGIRQSFKAFQIWLKNATPEEVANDNLPGLNFTHEQLFFLGFAQAWCGQIRPEAVQNSINTDAHCPGEIRVKGTVSNFDEFGRAFNCPVGSPMNPEKKCFIW